MRSTSVRSRGVSLRQVLPQAQFFGGDIRVSSCCGYAPQCQPGDLFAALVESEGDGHEQAFEAIERGAAAVLAERFLPVSAPICLVEDTRQAYGSICHALAGNPSQQLKTVGVTGTAGKTVTSLLVAAVLEQAGHGVGLTNSLGAATPENRVARDFTSPTAPEFAHWLSRMTSEGASHAVVEASSRALAERRLAGTEFDVAVVTNIKRDHLAEHGTLWNYRAAKSRILSHLSREGATVLNADDPITASLIDKISGPILTVGQRFEADLTATVLERRASEQTFLLHAGRESTPVRTAIIGDHHVTNCLQAAAAGLLLGIDLPTIVRGLESVTSVPGRLERIEKGQHFGVFCDYAATPDSLARSLKTLGQTTRGRVLCVFGAPGDIEPEMRPLLGRVAERYADYAVITDDFSGHCDPAEIAHDIIDGYDRAALAHMLPSRDEAIRYVLSMAKPGDSVLISSARDRSTLAAQGVLQADQEIAREWLESHQPTIRLFGASFSSN